MTPTPRGAAVGGPEFHTLSTLAALSAAFFRGRPPRALVAPEGSRAVARCLIIRTAVHQFACTIRQSLLSCPASSRCPLGPVLHARAQSVRGIIVVRGRRGGVGHVAEAFGYRIRRKMQIQGLRRRR